MTRRTLAMYDDVRQTLDAALAAGGGTFICESHGHAVHWRQRAYSFRKLFRDKVGGEASPYDRLTLKKIAEGSSEVIIKMLEVRGTFVPANPLPVPNEDPLLEDALAIAQDLLGDI